MYGIGQDIQYKVIVENKLLKRLSFIFWLDWKYEGSLEDYIEDQVFDKDSTFEINKIVELKEIKGDKNE